jgi:predicted membrane channel-forming protein YqfA (hemolysin III family)
MRGMAGSPDTRIRDVGIAVAVVAVVGLALWRLGTGGYPGGPDECIELGDCYCEAISAGLVAQAANAWSNGGFVLVGLAVLGALGGVAGSGLMARDLPVRRLYGAIAVFLGIGSFLFHGTMRAWGGYLDLLSMHVFIGFLLAYDLARIRGWGRAAFSAALWPLVAVFAGLLLVIPPEHGKTLFAVLVVVTLGLEAVAGRGRTVVHRIPWFWAGIVTFLAANVVWNLSRTGRPWCDPESLLQGHALWHLLTAATVWCLYRYLLADEARAPVAVGADRP